MKPSLKNADQRVLFEEPSLSPRAEIITREHLEAARQFDDVTDALDALDWAYDAEAGVREMLAWSRLRTRRKPR